ncbi:MAG: DUF1697 domain-containing protein [Pseudomonadota bacterium]|nr:DUF1697 domain-containing protein [Pseudomonadota bacterium]
MPVHIVLFRGINVGGNKIVRMTELRGLATTERFQLKGGTLYMHTPDGFGRSKPAEKLDSVLKVPLTVRNWRTVLKLLALAESIASA